jgi:membrane fusion protein (multidrug efflux system)
MACGCSSQAKEAGAAGGKGSSQQPPPAVRTSIVKVETIPTYGDFVGQSAAKETVNIVPRVTGFLEKIYFTEGAEVHRGEALFRIEQASYQISVKSAEAKLAQDEALLVKYQRDVARLEPLAREHAATQTDLDTAVSGAAQQQAAMKGDQAQIDTAKLNLSYTEIPTPIGGIIGKLNVTAGNLVNAGQSATLTTISSFDPIYVYFSIPEATYLVLRRKNGNRDGPPPIKLDLVLADGRPFPYRGVMNFADRTVDPQTGTLQGRAIFSNPGGLLKPGQFARVRFITDERPNSVLVPKGAVTETLNTKAVLVVDAANKAVQKTVTLDGDYKDFFIVHSGLTGGERVVVEGVQKVQPGMTVNPDAPASAAPAGGKKK